MWILRRCVGKVEMTTVGSLGICLIGSLLPTMRRFSRIARNMYLRIWRLTVLSIHAKLLAFSQNLQTLTLFAAFVSQIYGFNLLFHSLMLWNYWLRLVSQLKWPVRRNFMAAIFSPTLLKQTQYWWVGRSHRSWSILWKKRGILQTMMLLRIGCRF